MSGSCPCSITTVAPVGRNDFAVKPLPLRPALDEENNLFKVSGKQHVSFEVILVPNAMESFQQEVPPILLGAFEDIFD
jgi:hypothetical protein